MSVLIFRLLEVYFRLVSYTQTLAMSHHYSLPLQSSGWPGVVAVMANWFGKGKYVHTVCSVQMWICYVFK